MRVRFDHAFSVAGLIVVLSVFAAAQQPNHLNAALSFNGTGEVDATGAVMPTDAALPPSGPGPHPGFHHRAMAAAPLRMTVQGIPGSPVLLLAGTLLPAPLNIAGQLLEVDPTSAIILANGFTPTTPFDASAVIGSSGRWTVDIPQGLQATFPLLTFQAVLQDAGVVSLGLRFSASVALDVRNDIDTLMRNVADATTRVVDQPTYLSGLLSSGFLQDGQNGADFLLGLQVAVASGWLQDVGFDGIGPDAPSQAPLPAGPPSPGDNVPFYLQFRIWTPSGCAALGDEVRGQREHGLQAVDEAGVWRVRGNQRQVRVGADFTFGAGISNPQGLDVLLHFKVQDQVGVHGGITSVFVTGPQLLAVDPFGHATTASNGIIPLTLHSGAAPGPTEWRSEVWLAVAGAGTSRMPLVETAAGPRDQYVFIVHYADNTSELITVPLRAAVDPDASVAQALAAIPGGGAPSSTGVLSSAGTSSAQVMLTFPSGMLPDPTLFGRFSIDFDQGALGTSYDGVPIDPTQTSQTFSLCVPLWQVGVPTDLEYRTYDVYGNSYRAVETLTFL